MKKILILLVVITGLTACENFKNDFPDFDYTAGYFPYQYPVRTLVLGDYIYPNDNDNNHKFLISATMGGVYSNNQDRVFNIELSTSLCNNVKFASSGAPILLMPQSYYSLSSSSQLVIPKGKVIGSIEVQLSDAFFDDPLAIGLNYVIPLRIVSATNIDTVLRGKTILETADPRIASNWSILPKDFTMFAVKFINPYHGKYLHRGASIVKDASSVVLETTIYRQKFVEKDEVWSLVTKGKNKVSVSGFLKSTIITGNLIMDLTFSDNGNCTIANGTGSAYTITGSGKFSKDADSWGGELRDAIFINYQLTSGANTYFATDTLVSRDRAVVMEVFSPVVITK